METQRLPTDDFVTVQGAGSTTFRQPPMDGSLSLAQMIDFHAVYSAKHAWAVYPEENGEIQTVTWRHLGIASHRMALMMQERLKPNADGSPTVVAVLANRDSLTYMAMMVGILRAGFVPFLISPRNALPGVMNMLERSKTVAIISSSDHLEKILIDGVVKELQTSVTVVEAPVFNDLFDLTSDINAGFAPLLPEMASPVDNNVVSLIIHSSGSTSFPKPIPLSHLGVLQWARIPCYSYEDSCGRRTGIQSAPSFHGMGFFHGLAVPASSGSHIAVFKPQEPPIKPTPDRVLAAFKDSKINVATGPPSNLVAWVNDPEAVAYLKTLHWVRVGGGPLPSPVGDALSAQGVKILTGWGTTEVGVLSQPGPPEPYGADWEYVQLTRNAAPFFKPHGENVYEICFPCTPTHIPSVFNHDVDDPAKRSYHTSDLVELHPTRKGFFRILGRTDDQIMLSSGEKTNAGPLESIIRGCPLVNNAIFFGRGKFQNGSLIEPAKGHHVDPGNDAEVARFRNAIWTYVAQANTIAPSHSRIFKEMILVCAPDRPLLLTPKGTVSRPKSLDLYESEIEGIYASLEKASIGAIHPPKEWTSESVAAYCRAVTNEIMRPDGGSIDERDLFLQGCDSLQATVLRNRLLAGLRQTGKATEPPPPNWIYVNSTLASLSSSFLLATTTSSFAPAVADPAARVQLLEAAAAKYSQNFSPHTGSKALPGKKTVLLTGATGTLGSYLLAKLVDDPDVALVYAVNRPGSKPGLERQAEALLDRGLDPAILNDGRVVVVDADLSRSDFGIPASLFDEMLDSVTLIVHNAWRLDFNLALASFTPNIEGVRNLVDFALSSPFQTPPMIVNTSSVSVVSAHPTGWVAETSANPLHTAPTGYGQSKFVAERILEAAPLQTCSIRIGQLSGSLKNGAWNASDWLPMLIKSGEACRCLPVGNDDICWVPTDAAATIIAEFCRAAKVPNVLHLVHPSPIKWSAVVDHFSRALNVPSVSFDSWIKKLASSEDPKVNPAIKILSFFRAKPLTTNGTPGREAIGIPRVQTQQAIQFSETLATLPLLGAEDFCAWEAYWRRAGLLTS